MSDLDKYTALLKQQAVKRMDLSKGRPASSFVLTNESSYHCIGIIFPEEWSQLKLAEVKDNLVRFHTEYNRKFPQWVRRVYLCDTAVNTYVLVVGTLNEAHKIELLKLARDIGAVRLVAKEGNYYYSNPNEGKTVWDIDLSKRDGMMQSHFYNIIYIDGQVRQSKFVEAPCASRAVLSVEARGYSVVYLEALDEK